MNSNSTKFSVHTFMLSRQITREAWKEIKNYYYYLAENSIGGKVVIPKRYKQKRELQFLKYKYKGIIVYLKWIEDDTHATHFHHLEIRVNPRKLIGDDTYVGVFEFTE